MDWHSRRIAALIEAALREDHALADATTALVVAAGQEAQGEIIAKQDLTLAGLGIVPRVFAGWAELCAAQPGGVRPRPVVVTSQGEVLDGVRLRAGQTVAVARGEARQLLACERVILNFLQRLCGIATLTRRYVEAVAGTAARILDTRKTPPGLRLLDKYAVTCGGGLNHRADLSDGVLIKNNHIRLAGGVAAALERALARRRPGQPIEIEVRSLAELETALRGGAQRILLDNMTPEEARQAAAIAAGRAELEASGGINLTNVRAYAEAGVQYISVGALTHSAPAADLALRMVPV